MTPAQGSAPLAHWPQGRSFPPSRPGYGSRAVPLGCQQHSYAEPPIPDCRLLPGATAQDRDRGSTQDLPKLPSSSGARSWGLFTHQLLAVVAGEVLLADLHQAPERLLQAKGQRVSTRGTSLQSHPAPGDQGSRQEAARTPGAKETSLHQPSFGGKWVPRAQHPPRSDPRPPAGPSYWVSPPSRPPARTSAGMCMSRTAAMGAWAWQ